MLVLGIETATAHVGVALVNDAGLVGSFQVALDRRHAETLAPAIGKMLDACSVALSEVDAIGVDVGPGLFTGLRVGLATSKSMAFALERPMVAVTSLEALASAAAWSEALVVAVIDARRGEVFHQSFVAGLPVGDPVVETPESLNAALAPATMLIGDGAVRYQDVFAEQRVVTALSHPTAVSVARLCHSRAADGLSVSHDQIIPLYLRRPDAVANWATVSGQVSGPNR